MSFGYENTSLYKSRFDGFEFWNGRGWISNKSLYKKLCEHDTEINTLEELNIYQRKYFKLNG